jgi:hypothetical protein
MTKKLKIMIFGSDSCQNCLKQKHSFTALGVPFEFVDAMADRNQSLCDRMDVDELPHSICLFEDTLKPVHAHRGLIDAQSFMNSVVERLSGGSQKIFKQSLRPVIDSGTRNAQGDLDLLK